MTLDAGNGYSQHFFAQANGAGAGGGGLSGNITFSASSTDFNFTDASLGVIPTHTHGSGVQFTSYGAAACDDAATHIGT